MKKIPTLFERRFENHRVVEVLPTVTHGMEWVLEGEGDATIKIDGSCCSIIEGIREYLRNNPIEGLVFWKDGEPMCKIKRSDFGFEWPVEER